MSKYLVVLIWPAGLAVIIGVAFLLARREPAPARPRPARPRPARPRPGPAAREGGPHHSPKAPAPPAVRDAVKGTAMVALLAAIGAVVVLGLMSLLGLGVVHHGLTIDRPVFTWLSGHHVHVMAVAMKRLTKIGD